MLIQPSTVVKEAQQPAHAVGRTVAATRIHLRVARVHAAVTETTTSIRAEPTSLTRGRPRTIIVTGGGALS